MKKSMLLLAIFGLITLSGCASTKFTKNEPYTEADFQKSSTECEMMAEQAGYSGGSLIANIHRRGFFKRCMVGKGWSEDNS